MELKYKCIIVEDNVLERDALEMKLRKIDSLVVRAALADGMEAVSFLKSEDVDIVFSDIDMPDLSGIALLKSLKHPPVFVFISAHAEHAAESFELDVIDYIIKPARIERLIKATGKAIEYIKAKKNIRDENATSSSAPLFKAASRQVPAQTGIELVKTIDAQDYFFIKEKNTHIKLNMGDVLYIESMGDFSKIITIQQKTHFVLINLKNLEKQLPDRIFMRVHKQYIVNILHVQNISVSDIKLTSGDLIPVSIAYRQSLLDNVIHKKSLTRFGE